MIVFFDNFDIDAALVANVTEGAELCPARKDFTKG